MTSRAATEYRYEKLTWPEINEAIAMNKVCIIPCGAVEQHGEHLPLDVDLVCPGGIAAGVGQQMPDRVLVLPTIAYGYTGHVMDFPGTINTHYETFIRQVLDVTKSLVFHGFKKIILLNGHGSNMPNLDLAARRTNLETDGECILIAWWHLLNIETSPDRPAPPTPSQIHDYDLRPQPDGERPLPARLAGDNIRIRFMGINGRVDDISVHVGRGGKDEMSTEKRWEQLAKELKSSGDFTKFSATIHARAMFTCEYCDKTRPGRAFSKNVCPRSSRGCPPQQKGSPPRLRGYPRRENKYPPLEKGYPRRDKGCPPA